MSRTDPYTARDPTLPRDRRHVSVGVGFTEERIELFPTRFVRHQYDGLDGFNRGLTRRVLEREAQDQGDTIQRSNVGGWHSQSDLLRWDTPRLRF